MGRCITNRWADLDISRSEFQKALVCIAMTIDIKFISSDMEFVDVMNNEDQGEADLCLFVFVCVCVLD